MESDTSWFAGIMAYMVVVCILTTFLVQGAYQQSYYTPSFNILEKPGINGSIDLSTESEYNPDIIIQQGQWDFSNGTATVKGLSVVISPFLPFSILTPSVSSPTIAEFYLKNSLSKDGKYVNTYQITNVNATNYGVWIRTAPTGQDSIFMKVESRGYLLFRGYNPAPDYSGDIRVNSNANTQTNLEIKTIYDIRGNGDRGTLQVYANNIKIFDYDDVLPAQVSFGSNYYGGVFVSGLPDYIFGVIPNWKVPGFSVNSISVSSQNYQNQEGIWGFLSFAGTLATIVFWTPADIIVNGKVVEVFPWWLNAIGIKLPLMVLFYLGIRMVRGN